MTTSTSVSTPLFGAPVAFRFSRRGPVESALVSSAVRPVVANCGRPASHHGTPSRLGMTGEMSVQPLSTMPPATPLMFGSSTDTTRSDAPPRSASARTATHR